jgi:hypothetical protein
MTLRLTPFAEAVLLAIRASQGTARQGDGQWLCAFARAEGESVDDSQW